MAVLNLGLGYALAVFLGADRPQATAPPDDHLEEAEEAFEEALEEPEE